MEVWQREEHLQPITYSAMLKMVSYIHKLDGNEMKVREKKTKIIKSKFEERKKGKRMERTKERRDKSMGK